MVCPILCFPEVLELKPFYEYNFGEGGFKLRQDFFRRRASRFLVGAKTTGQLFLKFQHDIPSNLEMCE